MAALRILVSSVLLGCGMVVPGHAQTLSLEAIEEINAASKARARLRDGGWINLYDARADSTSLTFRRGEFLNRGGTLVEVNPPLLVSQLTQIQVSLGSRAASGAKIGGGIMAGLTMIAIVGCQGTSCEPTSGQALTALVGWTGIGAGVGALIGSGSSRWKTIHPTSGP
jgi:hypothetical protein